MVIFLFFGGVFFFLGGGNVFFLGGGQLCICFKGFFDFFVHCIYHLYRVLEPIYVFVVAFFDSLGLFMVHRRYVVFSFFFLKVSSFTKWGFLFF